MFQVLDRDEDEVTRIFKKDNLTKMYYIVAVT